MYRQANAKMFQANQETAKPGLSSLQKRIIGASLSLLLLLGFELLLMKLVFAFV